MWKWIIWSLVWETWTVVVLLLLTFMSIGGRKKYISKNSNATTKIFTENSFFWFVSYYL